MIDVILVGNPNTGKTTLYNTLTGAHEHVGNWHGVTVEQKSRKYSHKGKEINLVDLPGIYSLTPLSYEESEGTKYLLSHLDALVVNICDASNLQRNLYLTLGLLEAGAQVILAVNQIDKKPICKIDFASLEKELGIQVVYINASDKKSVAWLNDAIISFQPRPIKKLPYIQNLDFSILSDIKNIDKNDYYTKIKLLEDDETIKEKCGTDKTFDKMEEVASARYQYIDSVLSNVASAKLHPYGQSKFDKILLNRFLALPIFLLMLCVAFYITFFSLGAWLSDGLGFLLDRFIMSPISGFLVDIFGQGSVVVSLFDVAIAGGVGTIVSFLPQVALLFFFLSLLEDSGYLSRVAFVFDDLLSKVGLSGKSVYTLLMGFGCSTSAVLTARNMEDKNSKIKTALPTPYMSCSAKFPIYTVLGGAFFGAKNIFVIIGLYFLGVVIAVLLSYIFEKTVLKSKGQSFILEFPPYRSMSFKRTISLLWQNIKLFLSRVASLILAMNVIVWVLSSFTATFKFIGDGQGVSLLQTFGMILSPLFVPLGFSSWGLISALIAGLVAKEIVVSSIAMFNGADGISSSLESTLFLSSSAAYFASASSVLSYLVFCLLYFPCVATCSVLWKEIGKKWTIIGVIIEFVVAYVIAMLTYHISFACEIFSVWKVLLSLAAVACVVISIVVVIKKLKRKKLCPYSGNCDGGCKGCK